MGSFSKRKACTVIGLVLVFGAATMGAVIVRAHRLANTIPASTPSMSGGHTTAIKGTPLFSFDASKAPGWKQGPADKISMALFKQDTHCFASVELRNGTVDEAQELAKALASFNGQGYGVATRPLANTKFFTTSNPSGVPYALHPYTLSGTGEGGYKTQAFGYVPLGSQYINVQAYCSDDTTLPQIEGALSAITLKT